MAKQIQGLFWIPFDFPLNAAIGAFNLGSAVVATTVVFQAAGTIFLQSSCLFVFMKVNYLLIHKIILRVFERVAFHSLCFPVSISRFLGYEFYISI